MNESDHPFTSETDRGVAVLLVVVVIKMVDN